MGRFLKITARHACLSKKILVSKSSTLPVKGKKKSRKSTEYLVTIFLITLILILLIINNKSKGVSFSHLQASILHRRYFHQTCPIQFHSGSSLSLSLSLSPSLSLSISLWNSRIHLPICHLGFHLMTPLTVQYH